jgi:hypothetical protein
MIMFHSEVCGNIKYSICTLWISTITACCPLTDTPPTQTYDQAQTIKLGATQGQNGRITLNWNVPAISVTPDSYWIIRAAAPGTLQTDPANSTVTTNAAYADTAVLAGTYYYFRIAAYYGGALVAYSDEAVGIAIDSSATQNPDFIFVDASAPGGGNGSSVNPYNTIADGIANVNAGGIVLVRDGVYTLTAGLTLSKQVELRSETGTFDYSDAILDGGSVIIAWSALDTVVGSDGSKILGLEWRNFWRQSTSNGIIRISAGDNVKIIKNYLHDNQGVNISTIGTTSGVEISGNKIVNVTYSTSSAMKTVGLTNFIISGNEIDTVVYAGVIFDWAVVGTISNNVIRNTQNHGFNIGGGPGCGNLVLSGNILDNCNLSLTADSGGIRIYGPPVVEKIEVKNNRVTNSFNGIVQRNTSGTWAFDITIRDNSLTDNASHSIYNLSADMTLDAINNWYGTASGPYHLTGNPTGTGDPVSDYVTFSPWLTEDPNP